MDYRSLDAWRQAMLLVKNVYELTGKFPKEEVYALALQVKRAVVSVPSNIAEGIGRNYKKDTIQFLHISRGSLYELETLLNIAVMLSMISKENFEKISGLITKNQQLINGLIRHFEQPNLK